MRVEQVAELVNEAYAEAVGKSAVLADDLSNVVDFGEELTEELTVNGGFDNYVRSLIDHIGKVVFVDRPYNGSAPSVLKDAWEYGSVLEKIQMEIPEADENSAWSLEDGAIYSQDVFYKPVITAKFYNSKTTFEVPMSITTEQVEEAFSSASQLNAFVSMIYNTIDKALTVAFDNLIMRTIDAYITKVATSKSGQTMVYLDTLYTAATGSTYQGLTDPEFIKFASYVIKLYASRMNKISTLFNVEGKARFTPTDKLHIVLLDNFASASEIYLESDTYHNELLALPKAETVAFWQGSGVDYSTLSCSTVCAAGDDGETKTEGVLGVMFDDDAIAVCNTRRKVNTHYNAKGDFMNYYYKAEASYLADTAENFVVFAVSDPSQL